MKTTENTTEKICKYCANIPAKPESWPKDGGGTDWCPVTDKFVHCDDLCHSWTPQKK